MRSLDNLKSWSPNGQGHGDPCVLTSTYFGRRDQQRPDRSHTVGCVSVTNLITSYSVAGVVLGGRNARMTDARGQRNPCSALCFQRGVSVIQHPSLPIPLTLSGLRL